MAMNLAPVWPILQCVKARDKTLACEIDVGVGAARDCATLEICGAMSHRLTISVMGRLSHQAQGRVGKIVLSLEIVKRRQGSRIRCRPPLATLVRIVSRGSGRIRVNGAVALAPAVASAEV